MKKQMVRKFAPAKLGDVLGVASDAGVFCGVPNLARAYFAEMQVR
jgi:hypothetical protein